ncbi:MAG: 50S ribosomal protein L32e [Promethearchaeota archaeon]|nr:MAG: 50S ribosomal protein L32e [Candidatus Lokiarchaeota archaeon]
MEKNRLMELRKNKKKKNPKFRRVESWRYKRVKDSWRKARGIDSQTRKKTKSGVKSPSVGYRSPKKVRGLHPSGYEEVRVTSINDLKGLSNKRHAIKISGRLGTRKRIPLVEYAQNRGFRILNMGISQRELESFESMLQSPIEDLEDDFLEGEDLEDSLDLED